MLRCAASRISIALLFGLSIGLLSFGDARAKPTFCSVDLTDLTPQQKEKLDAISKLTAEGPVPVQTWNTRTIPYYVQSDMPSTLVIKLQNAAKTIARASNVRFVKCSARIAEQKSVEGFVYVGKRDEFCSGTLLNPSACSVGLGKQPKTKATGNVDSKDSSIEANLKRMGAIIGLRSENREDEIVHELIHRLGFSHQHQHPRAVNFSDIALTDSNCVTESKRLWLEYYDPASIMHYDLRSCKMQLKCDETGKVGQFIRLKHCSVDKIISEGLPCIYKPGVKGEACFKRPQTILDDGSHGASDFGQEQCISILDQALLLAYYPRSVAEDAYGIANLANGVCEAVPP